MLSGTLDSDDPNFQDKPQPSCLRSASQVCACGGLMTFTCVSMPFEGLRMGRLSYEVRELSSLSPSVETAGLPSVRLLRPTRVACEMISRAVGL